MRDDLLVEDTLNAKVRAIAQDRWRELASIGFVLIAVASIHFQEHLSPFMDRVGIAWSDTTAKTLKSANLAWAAASLPFILRS